MATEAPFALRDGTRVAGEDLSSHQYKFVKLAADGDIEVCDAVTDRPYGVLQNAPSAGEVCDIVRIGFTKLVAGADLAPAAEIGTDTSGRAVAKTRGTDLTHFIVGEAVGDPGAANEIFRAGVNCVAPGTAAATA